MNPLDTDLFFVRQQYLDFLGREPDAEGLAYWTDQIRSCANDQSCRRSRRIAVSAAYFDSEEFQTTGSFVYRVYKGSLGRLPQFGELATDRQHVVAGGNLEAAQLSYSEQFVQRPEFMQRFQTSTTGESFVFALLESVRQSSGVDLHSEYHQLLTAYNSRSDVNQARAAVLASVGRAAAFRDAEYNRGFVLMEYFGYLRRDPDLGGYAFWLDVLNGGQTGNYRGMVCAFITSAEYQRRFSPVVTATNSDCGP